MSKRPEIISSNLKPSERIFSAQLGRQKIADGIAYLKHSVADDVNRWTCDFSEIFRQIENHSSVACDNVTRYIEKRFGRTGTANNE